MIHRLIRGGALSALLALPVSAQQNNAAELTVQRIFRANEFRSVTVPDPTWLSGGIAYAELRQNQQGGPGEDNIQNALNHDWPSVRGWACILGDYRRIKVFYDGPRCLKIEQVGEQAHDNALLLTYRSDAASFLV